MMKDMQGVEHYEKDIDYFEALKKVQDNVDGIDQREGIEGEDEDELEADYLMNNIEIE